MDSIDETDDLGLEEDEGASEDEGLFDEDDEEDDLDIDDDEDDLGIEDDDEESESDEETDLKIAQEHAKYLEEKKKRKDERPLTAPRPQSPTSAKERERVNESKQTTVNQGAPSRQVYVPRPLSASANLDRRLGVGEDGARDSAALDNFRNELRQLTTAEPKPAEPPGPAPAPSAAAAAAEEPRTAASSSSVAAPTRTAPARTAPARTAPAPAPPAPAPPPPAPSPPRAPQTVSVPLVHASTDGPKPFAIERPRVAQQSIRERALAQLTEDLESFVASAGLGPSGGAAPPGLVDRAAPPRRRKTLQQRGHLGLCPPPPKPGAQVAAAAAAGGGARGAASPRRSAHVPRQRPHSSSVPKVRPPRQSARHSPPTGRPSSAPRARSIASPPVPSHPVHAGSPPVKQWAGASRPSSAPLKRAASRKPPAAPAGLVPKPAPGAVIVPAGSAALATRRQAATYRPIAGDSPPRSPRSPIRPASAMLHSPSKAVGTYDVRHERVSSATHDSKGSRKGWSGSVFRPQSAAGMLDRHLENAGLQRPAGPPRWGRPGPAVKGKRGGGRGAALEVGALKSDFGEAVRADGLRKVGEANQLARILNLHHRYRLVAGEGAKSSIMVEVFMYKGPDGAAVGSLDGKKVRDMGLEQFFQTHQRLQKQAHGQALQIRNHSPSPSHTTSSRVARGRPSWQA